MERVIYEVYAKVVDENGNYNTLSNYPKVFDSRHYDGDLQKTFRRAQGEYHETYGAMCKRDDRQVQTVLLIRQDGLIIESASIGSLSEPEETEE